MTGNMKSIHKVLFAHIVGYKAISCGWARIAFTVLAIAIANNASALVVQTWNGEGTPQLVNTTAPADDPGWHNASSNRSTIYLGNQWVLTAEHAGTGAIELPSGRYEKVPGTEVILSNPTSLGPHSLSGQSDLRMYRIGLHPTSGLSPELEDSNVKDISISSSTPSFNTEVLMIGAGQVRVLNTDPGSFNGQTDFGNDIWGFPKVGSDSLVKTWGTNRISSTTTVSGVKRSGLNVLIEFNSGINDVIGQIVQFDRSHDDQGNPVSVSTPDEAMGAGGDSGGPVFYKDGNDEWQLSGLMHGIYAVDTNNAKFTQSTGISDLSHYKSQIELLLSNDDYSVMGDLDLDGSVTGEIINGSATGDLAEMVANWGYTQAFGDVVSWTKGDLNLDGTVNLSDFVMLRGALGGSVSASQFSALVTAASAVPEPTSAAITVLAVLSFAVHSRRN